MEQTSKFKGVKFCKKRQMFHSVITSGKTVYRSGYSKSDLEVVKLRDLLIIRHKIPNKALQVIKPKE